MSAKICMGDGRVASRMLGVSFKTSFAMHTAYGHRFADATFGHRLFAWSSIVRANPLSSPMRVQLCHFGGEHLLQQRLNLGPCFGMPRPICWLGRCHCLHGSSVPLHPYLVGHTFQMQFCLLVFHLPLLSFAARQNKPCYHQMCPNHKICSLRFWYVT